MAGIGFRLQKMLMEETYTGILKAYFYSAVISSGPWLLSILCLSLLGILSPVLLHKASWFDMKWEIFGITVVYVFASSLIMTGLITMVITRYIADKIYLGEDQVVSATYATISIVVVIFQGMTGGLFFAFVGENIWYWIAATSLYITVSGIWIAMIFLSASENYKLITIMFFAGSLLSLGTGLAGGRLAGFTGFLNGYAVGQVTIFVGLSYVIFSEFGLPTHFDFKFASYFKNFYELVLIGFIYHVAIWSDKFIFWFSDVGTHIQGLFYNFIAYDSPLFLAYLTIIPSLAIFLLNIETDFYREYREFYRFVMDKKPFAKITEKKLKMLEVIQRSLVNLLKIQGLITFLAIYFAPELLSGLRVTESLSIQIFRYAAAGAFFHGYVLIFMILLLYYDLRKETLILILIFAAGNILFTFISKSLGPSFYGSGYMMACLIAFVAGYAFLVSSLRQLEYHTFINQPIIGKRSDSPRLRARIGGGYGEYVNLREAGNND